MCDQTALAAVLPRSVSPLYQDAWECPTRTSKEEGVANGPDAKAL